MAFIKSLAMKTMQRLMGIPTCEEVAEVAYRYLEGRLDPETTRRLEKHLQGCLNCQRFVESYRRVASAGRVLRNLPLEPEIESRISKFLQRQFRNQASQRPSIDPA